jgi:hypothetical protein
VEAAGGRVRFTAPEFLVYGIARIHLEPANRAARESGGPAAPMNRGRRNTSPLRQTVSKRYAREKASSAPFEPFDHPECSHSF